MKNQMPFRYLRGRSGRFRSLRYEQLEDRVVLSHVNFAPIQAFVYLDNDANGVPSGLDIGIEGVPVTLTINGVPTLTRATDINGRAWFGPGWDTNATIEITAEQPEDFSDGQEFYRGFPDFNYVTVGEDKFTFTNFLFRDSLISQGSFGSNTFFGISEAFFFGELAEVDLEAKELEFDLQSGNLRFSYEVKNMDLVDDTTAAVFWASGEKFDDRIGAPIREPSVEQAVGTYGPFIVSKEDLGSPPLEATHLLLVLDPDDLIAEKDEENNIIALELPLPDLRSTSLEWSETPGGGVDLHYSLVDLPLRVPSTVKLYWADGPSLGNRIGAPIYSMSAESEVGDYGPFNVSQAMLGNPPTGANQLLLVVDPDDTILEADEDNNILPLKLIDISPLHIELADGLPLTFNAEKNRFEGVGTIFVGLDSKPFRPLIQLNGSAWYDQNRIHLEGVFFAAIGVASPPLFDGVVEIVPGQSTSLMLNEQNEPPSSFNIAGADIAFTGIQFRNDGVGLQGRVILPEALGGKELAVHGSNWLLFTDQGVRLTGERSLFPT